MPVVHDSKGRRRVRPSVEALESRRLLASFVVTNTADTGDGSLRQAILDADANPGLDTISFDIPGGGVRTIAPTTPLPDVTDPAVIDGTTEPGYSGTPRIELDGGNIFLGGPEASEDIPVPSVNGLTLAGGDSLVKGLDINRFSGYGIGLSGDGNTISGNFLGTDPTGALAEGNGLGGLFAETLNNQIGGPVASDRNVISGNDGYGIVLASQGGMPTHDQVQGNFIGTDATGVKDLGNAYDGINIESSDNLIGGESAALANTIAFNGRVGVQVGYYNIQTGVDGNAILGNSIFSDVGLGIALGYPSPIQQPPVGSGPNRGISTPQLTSAYSVNGGTAVEGLYLGTPNTTYRIELFADTAPDPSGYGQGRTFLGATDVTTDSSGRADVFATVPTGSLAGEYLSDTATDPRNDTSEFAPTLPILSAPTADLSASEAGSPMTIPAGGDIAYILSAASAGPNRATNVTLSDVLPSGVTFVSANPTQGTATFANGTVTANFGTLDNGQSAGLVLVVRPSQVQPITNTVTVRADQADPNPANDTATVTTTTLPPPPADLSVLVTAAPPAIALGQTLTYSIAVTNDGPSPASGVVVTNVLPAGSSVISSQSTQGSLSTANGTITASLGLLAPGASALITIVVKPGAEGTAVDSATVSADQPDNNLANNTSVLASPVAAGPTPAPDTTAPTVLAQKLTLSGRAITSIVLTYDKAMAAATVGNLANYTIRDLGAKGTTSATGPKVPLASATFDPATETVTLVPRKPLAIGRFYELILDGPRTPGITDASVIPLDGDRNGLADGIYTSLFGRGTPTRPNSLQIGATVPQPPPGSSTTTTRTRNKLVHHDESTTRVSPARVHTPKARHPRATG